MSAHNRAKLTNESKTARGSEKLTNVGAHAVLVEGENVRLLHELSEAKREIKRLELENHGLQGIVDGLTEGS